MGSLSVRDDLRALMSRSKEQAMSKDGEIWRGILARWEAERIGVAYLGELDELDKPVPEPEPDTLEGD